MCGIAGFSGDYTDRAALEANRAQCHRGPDDSGVFVDEEAHVGLVHVRLSIQDPSPLGHQPMTSDDGRWTLIYNGEIYNAPSLRPELEREGYRFRGTSDTEVLLTLLRRDGLDALPRLNGIFALALWDHEAGTLLLARDALGVKPLYYAATERGVCFASEVKALLRIDPTLRELDHEAIHRYLTFLWCPGAGTPLKDVRKMDPGAWMKVRDGRVVDAGTWYELPGRRGVRGSLSVEESIRGTHDELRRAVHAQLLSDVPVGAFLSGGLDSSAVVAFAREEIPDLACFTIDAQGIADEGLPEDLPYARRVAEHLDVDLHVVHVDPHQMARDLPGMVAQLDEPLADPAPLNVRYISALARKQGMKVLLSGAGGDDLFTGYRRHLAARYDRLWGLVPPPLGRGLSATANRLDKRTPTGRRLARLASTLEFQGDERLAQYFVWAGEDTLRDLYTPEMRQALGTSRATRPMLDFLDGVPDSLHPIERLLALEQRFFLADHNLAYTDRMSMQAGVEVRVPFLDPELVEFAARIPPGVRQKGRTGKWVLKKAMEPHLPHDVIYRAKTGFGAPLRGWMRGELRPVLNDVLGAESLRDRGLFDPTAVRTLIEDNEAGRVDAAYLLLALLNIELWCRAFIDGRAE